MSQIVPMNSEYRQGYSRRAHFAYIRVPTDRALAWMNTVASERGDDPCFEAAPGMTGDLGALLRPLGPQYFCPPWQDRETDVPIIEIHCDVVLLDEGSDFVWTRHNSDSVRTLLDDLAKRMKVDDLHVSTRVVPKFDFSYGPYASILFDHHVNNILRWRKEKDEERKKQLRDKENHEDMASPSGKWV